MDELLIFFKTANRIEFLLNEILYSLNIVVGYLFNVLHTLGIGRRKLTIDVAKKFKASMINILQLWQRQFAQGNKILDFHTYSISDKGIFREIRG